MSTLHRQQFVNGLLLRDPITLFYLPDADEEVVWLPLETPAGGTTVVLTAASFGFTTNSLGQAFDTTTALASAAFTFTANAIGILADTLIALASATFSFAARPLGLDLGLPVAAVRSLLLFFRRRSRR